MQIPGSIGIAPLVLAVSLCPSAHAQWTTRPLSVPRSLVGMATAGSKVFIAGGVAGGQVSDAVDIYDDATGTWSTSTLPSPAFQLSGASVGPYVLFAGASYGTSAVYVYDTRTDQWSTVDLAQGRDQIAMVAVGSKVIFAGGGIFGVGLHNIDIYDARLGVPGDPTAWSTSSLLHQRSDAAGFSVDGHAVVAGGDNALSTEPWIEVFDADARSLYETRLSSGFLPRAGTGLGSLAIMATYGGGITRFESLDIYTGAEAVGPTIPVVHGLAAATLGDRALFVGSTYQLNAIDAVHVYNGVTGQWSSSDLPAADRALSVAAVGSKAIFAGGIDGENVLIYDDGMGQSYCSPGVPNSTGGAARITAQGAPATAIGGSTRLNVSGLPQGSFGFVLASQSRGLSMPALSQGRLCLSGTIARFSAPGLILSGPTGSVSFDHASIPGSAQAAVLPGDVWNYQCWYRDTNPAVTSNFTDAVAVLYQ